MAKKNSSVSSVVIATFSIVKECFETLSSQLICRPPIVRCGEEWVSDLGKFEKMRLSDSSTMTSYHR